MRQWTLGSMVVTVFIAFAACAPEDEIPWGTFGRPIINGDPDNTMAHRAVVYIQHSSGFACTGTLIGPRVILTAAHCTKNESTGSTYSASGFTVVFFSDSDSQYGSRGVSAVHPHTSFNFNDLAQDIAVLILSSDAPSGVTPIPPLPSSLAVTTADIGTNVEFVGYGVTEYGYPSGTKLTVDNAIDRVCTNSNGCSWNVGGVSAYLAQDTICYDESPGGPCSGDSGGPAFILRSGTEYVAGITSYGDQNCEYYGCSTKVDAYQSFLAQYLTGANGSSCSNSTQCNSGYCVDGVCCESACDTNPCRSCNTATAPGSCAAVPNGTSCGTTDPCVGAMACMNGSCSNMGPLNCDDGNVCTFDECVTNVGCRNTPLAEGTSCSDGNLCNGQETCSGGVCQDGFTLPCDDDEPCTTDHCDPTLGCLHDPLPDGQVCGQGDVCLGTATCQGGVCTSAAPLVCMDNNNCTEEYCDPTRGCMYPQVDCDDHNPCTADSCQNGPGCLNLPANEGVNCGGGYCGQGICVAGTCTGPDVPVCDDLDPCTTDFCDPSTGCRARFLPDGAVCGLCMRCQAHVCAPDLTCTMEPEGGRGCSASSTTGGLSWLAVALVLGWRRIRRRNP